MPDRHVAVYLRVSTRAQDLRSQEPELRRWVAARAEGEETVRWYSDQATGTTMDRPGWRKLEAAMRRGEVSTIVVWRFDRLGRDREGLAQLLAELKRRRVSLISLREGFDLGTPIGELMVDLLAALARYEREVLLERQRAGIDAARAAGKRWGGRKPGQRYKVTPEVERQVLALLAVRDPRPIPIASIARTVRLARQTIYDIRARAAA